MEHRCGTRYPVDVGVYARTLRDAVSSVGQLCEVSISGGRILTALPVRVFAYISVEILVPGRPSIEGQVVRRAGQQVAIEWNDYAPWLIQLLTDQTPALPETRANLTRGASPLADPEDWKWQETPTGAPR